MYMSKHFYKIFTTQLQANKIVLARQLGCYLQVANKIDQLRVNKHIEMEPYSFKAATVS